VNGLLAAAMLPAVLLLPAAPAAAATLPNLTPAQSDYVEHCSGCHGMQGNSAPAAIPVLRDRVGYFMCTREGRDYLIRLPNVAFSALDDNQELADMMNFVVFGLGGASAPKGAKPFSAAEVARLRQQALTTQSLVETRARIVDNLVRSCGVPATMRNFSDGYSDAGQPSR
jgi:hypothetical protein